jgi:glutamyl-tRNA reductase
MAILCIGLNHHTAPLELRERLSFSPLAVSEALARFASGRESRSRDFTELAILSTCNRLELYANVATGPDARSDPFAPLLDVLFETRGLPIVEFELHLYRYMELAAAEHLCRVASGLDSMILGEPQILGQVAEAYEAAIRHDAVGPILSELFRAAIRAGKRARTETAISRNPASAGSVAVRLAEQVVGELAGRRVVVVGAGEMGELAVEALRARGVRQIAVVNRTRQRAIELAERWGGEALSFEHLTEAIHKADIVITSTGAPHAIINPAIAREALADRAEQPLVLIDIAVPRDVHPDVCEIPGVHLFDIDHLHSRLEGAIAERQNEIPRVEAIVAEEVATFDSWLRGVDILPVIADLRAKAESIRQRELRRALRRLPDLDPRMREQIEHLSESLINKLLHEPTLRLRAEAGNGHTAEYAQTVRHLFGLAVEPPQLTTLDKDRWKPS